MPLSLVICWKNCKHSIFAEIGLLDFQLQALPMEKWYFSVSSISCWGPVISLRNTEMDKTYLAIQNSAESDELHLSSRGVVKYFY